jgi:hypothetical protein
VQAAHDEAHRDNESLLVLMFALKLYWETAQLILVVVNRKGGTGKTTIGPITASDTYNQCYDCRHNFVPSMPLT